MKITAIQPDPHRSGAVRLLVDGKPLCTIPTESVASEHLTVGKVFDSKTRHRAERAADGEAAYRTVLRALERRPYARQELARRLTRRGHPTEAVAAALDRAQAAGLIDDASFAAAYVDTRSARGRGPARITRDLAAMGVDRAVIDQALLERWPRESDTRSLAAALAAKRAAQLGALPVPVKRRRILGFLARRGFRWPEVTALVRRLVEVSAKP